MEARHSLARVTVGQIALGVVLIVALFVFGGFPYAFLANFVVDGAIVLITYWFYRAARPELVFPAR